MRISATAAILALALLASTLGAAQATAGSSFFDVFPEQSFGAPPYPSADVITIIGADFGDSGPRGTHECRSSVSALSLNGLPPGTPVIISGHGGGGGGGGGAFTIDSFFDVFLDLDLGPPVTGQWNRRVSDVHIVHPPGTPPGAYRLVPINPAAQPGSVASFFDIFVESSFFDITYRVADDDGEHTLHTHCVSPSGRMSFFDVFVELGNPVPDASGHYDSFFDVFVDMEMQGPRVPGVPDASCQTTGDFSGGATAATTTTWGRLKSLYR
jgi:hypothetical protein